MSNAVRRIRAAEVSTTIAKVTPALAKEWLATSRINRRITQSSVLEYAIAMERGEWRVDGPSVSFTDDGCLSNGHHRLHAVILAGVGVDMTIQRGVSLDTREVEDSGKQRTLVDKISMFRPKVINVTTRLAFTRMCVTILAPNVRVRSLSDWDNWSKVFGEGVDWATSLLISAPTRLKRASVGGALAFAYKTNPTEVMSFGEEFVTRTDAKPGYPAYTLRYFIDRGGDDQDAQTRVILARKVLSCVSAHLQGQTLTKVYDRLEVVKGFTEAYKTPKVTALVTPWSRRVGV